jgi:4-hydroxybenzoate polyprenyltransferase
MKAIRLYWSLSRPFTLIPPMVGILSGSVIACAARQASFRTSAVGLALVAAATLNAASNSLNQIFDLEIDRVNKPQRPLASGALKPRGAWLFTILCYCAALGMAALVNLQTFGIYLVASIATVAYSAPPFRLKRHAWASNLTIAVTRGELLKVAGWAVVATVFDSLEPWYIGFIYFLFLMGATTTKDFVDISGDRKAACVTLPIRYGVAASVRIISPFFVLPWLVMALGAFFKVLSGTAWAILLLSLGMLIWGVRVAYSINTDPERLVREGENHPSWRQMYWMMMTGHLGLAAAYCAKWLH